ncbi:MAG TPA: hypothetical protein PLU80_10445 [Acidobacteriota bacterium]|nr:hypothetical protein [Acidobacteriota bacterium]
MGTILIKNESKPLKCEICHQTDLFDVETQVCLRCKDLASVPSASKPVEAFSDEDRASFFRRLNDHYQTISHQETVAQLKKPATFHISVATVILNGLLFVVLKTVLALILSSASPTLMAVFSFFAFVMIETAIVFSIRPARPVLAQGISTGLIISFFSPFMILVLMALFYVLGETGNILVLVSIFIAGFILLFRKLGAYR